MSQFEASLTRPHRKQHYAGDIEAFPTGHMTYLAPKPLPTGALPMDYSHAVGVMNDRYLDFGIGKSAVFMWQMTLFVPFGMFLLCALIFPTVVSLYGYGYGNGAEDANSFFWQAFDLGFRWGLGAGLVGLFLFMVLRWQMYAKVEKIIPTRFNRQRREVCFMPEGHSEPIFIPWEELAAWTMEAQGVTEYGVRRQYGFGIGFYHPDTGERFTLEFETHGKPLSIYNWEALRAYMEYEVHTLKEIQPQGELMDEGEEPSEGVPFFYNAHRKLHSQRRAGKVGWIYTFFWYLYHIMTFWTIPNRLVEWENKKMERLSNQALPESMEAWSQPLPESEWAKPSETLKRLSDRLRVLRAAKPDRPITDLYADLHAEEVQAGRI
ncbi:MAG TPA: hypothetical protein ENH62_14450 [Marinobacter sp.]|uniref:Uncharacterized protein n=2 Tax=root TaxID=1 RepID=A0A831W352_9GAMM|nr:hypothetical protein [Marinobacter antarcticus]HDZ39451.1 hypothetical protein [Marinobacter sp.]HEA54047.1 hypothetical protein [Marinobacter antarcticus]